MKILFICADDANESSFAFQCVDALRALRHDVRVFNYRKLQLHRHAPGRKLIDLWLRRSVAQFAPDLLLTIKGEALLPGTITTFRNKGIKTVNWVLDEPFGKYSKFNLVKNLQEYNQLFFFDAHYAEQLAKQGLQSHYLPVGAHPSLHREIVPAHQRRYNCDLCFIGSHHEKREQLFQQLVNYDFKIFGYRWNQLNKKSTLLSHVQPTMFKANKSRKDCEAMCRQFNLSKINLNVHHVQAVHGGANLRIFECLATNSFMLSDNHPGLDKLFRIGKEIVCYDDAADLKKKIDYYLAHEEERLKIAKAGQQRVLKEHTVSDRIKVILEAILV